jgi:hypothetical protein
MKVERSKAQFNPITITIESLDDLKWFMCIANCSVNEAKRAADGLSIEFDRDKMSKCQMSLWNEIVKFEDEVCK